jgi:hypothetical protein
VDSTDRETRRENLKRTSFWLPEFTPEAKPEALERPDKRPRSPMTGAPLRVKVPISVVPADLMRDPAGPARAT